MNPNHILEELNSIKIKVERQLKKKGLVPAKRRADGTIKIGSFSIMKQEDGFFAVLDSNSNIMASRINLPHTAAIFANNLALGRWTDREILDIDRRYGHYSFDEELYKQHFNKSFQSKNYDKAEIINEKFRAAKLKKDLLKNQILSGFDKLIKIT